MKMIEDAEKTNENSTKSMMEHIEIAHLVGGDLDARVVVRNNVAVAVEVPVRL